MVRSVITKGALISYVAIVIDIAISFVYTPWMIRTIGIANYGLYSLILTFLSYFIMDFGLSMSVQRFIARYRAEENTEKVSNLVGLTTKIYLFIDFIIFLVLLVLFLFLSEIFAGLSPDELETFKGLYIIAAVFSVLTFIFKPMNGAMMAYEYFVENKTLDMIQRVGTVLIICVALYNGASVYALVLVNGAVALFISILKYLVFKRKSKLSVNWKYFDRQEFRNITTFSVWAFGRDLAQKFKIALVPMVLGIFSNSSEISIFALSMTLESTIWSFSSAINGLFLPRVSKLVAKGDYVEVNNLMLKVGRIELYLISLLFLGFLCFGKQFLILWVGTDFVNVYYVVLLLIFTHLISLTQYIAENLVYVKNRIKDTVLIMLGCSLLGLGVACILASEYGAIGCGYGTFVGLILTQIFYNIYYYRCFKIDILCFFENCHFKILPKVILLTIPFYLSTKVLLYNEWWQLILIILLYSLSYLFVVRRFCANESEISLFKSLIGR